MKINRNMSAVITNNQMLRTENRLTASMERLSSGFKINRPGDNPAGMAISNKMKAQIDALDQAHSNATDGKSVLQIADGALNEVSSMLQRMRELSVQAANGTNSRSDRISIQAEIDKLKEEVNRISSDTEYNTKTLLDGSSDVRVYSNEATRLAVSDTVLPGNYLMTVDAPASQASYSFELPGPVNSSLPQTITINGVVMDYAATPSEAFFEKLRDTAEEGGCKASFDSATNVFTVMSKDYGSDEEVQIEFSKDLGDRMLDKYGWTLELDPGDPNDEEDDVIFIKDGAQKIGQIDRETGAYILTYAGEDAKVTLDRSGNSTFASFPSATASVDGLRVKVTDVGGFSMDFLLNEPKTDAAGKLVYDENVAVEVTDIGAMTIQIGANQYQEMDVRIPEVSTESLYLDTIDVTVKKGPEKAMVTLDEAIVKLNEIRSRIGAFQNRLEYASNSLAATKEDLTAAYSNILDTDMAEEMTEYTQQSVLDQASISVLSQANDIPQQILSLLQ